MKLELITDFEALQSNADQWDRVASMASPLTQLKLEQEDWENRPARQPSPLPFPFYRWSWLGNWFRHCGPQGSAYVLVAKDESGTWLGIAPFFIDRSSLTSQLKWWGSGAACTDYMGMIASEENMPAFALAVADWLNQATRPAGGLASIDRIELEGGTDAMSSIHHLQQSLDAVGFRQHDSELEGCWVVQLPATWQELECKFSKSMRRKTKKAAKRIDDFDTRIRSSRDHQIESLWPEFIQLHQQRREALGQAGCFANPGFEAFLKSATEELAREGQAELVVIDYGERALATMLLFNDGQTNMMYQSGADVERMNLEPGYQMAYLSIQHSIEQGMEFFDFLRGDEPYKSRWNSQRVPLYRTRCIPRKLKAIVLHNLWLTGRSLKSKLARL